MLVLDKNISNVKSVVVETPLEISKAGFNEFVVYPVYQVCAEW